MNVAFKHLEAKLRVGDLTVGQWAGVVGGVLAGLAFAQYVSPFGGVWALILGVYVGAVPATAALFASLSEFDLWGLVAAAARWHRSGGAHVPGAGVGATGYFVLADADAQDGTGEQPGELVLSVLWELGSPANGSVGS